MSAVVQCLVRASSRGVQRFGVGLVGALLVLASNAVRADITVADVALSEADHAIWRGLTEERVENRAFRAPIVPSTWPAVPPDLKNLPTNLHRTAALNISQNLAFDGLLTTLLNLVRLSGMPDELWETEAALSFLMEIGYPVDLLVHFAVPAHTPPATDIERAMAVVAFVHEIARAQGSEADSATRLAAARFVFRRSNDHLTILAEDEAREPALMRLHCSSDRYWKGEGDGGVLDVTRQMFNALPRTPAVVHVRAEHLAAVNALLKEWGSGADRDVTLLPQDMTLSQWAQDNGKSAMLDGVPATLAPRFATRGEDAGWHMPGDSLAMHMLWRSGHLVVQSPLLFQGGNVKVVTSPKDGARLLMMGEAEVWRNRALGLSDDQILQAFRAEFGADRCLILPAVSFHIDFEVFVFRGETGSMAYVNDVEAAAVEIIDAAISSLERHGVIPLDDATSWHAHIAAKDWGKVAPPLSRLLISQMNTHQQFTTNLAAFFSAGPSDDGVGNLQRILLALDRAVTWSLEEVNELDSFPAQEYAKALGRREVGRQALVQGLIDEGFQIVKVPGSPDGARGISPLNAIVASQRVLFSAYGGVFSGFDKAVADQLQRIVLHNGQNATVIPVLTAESQRRDGGLHCAVSLY